MFRFYHILSGNIYISTLMKFVQNAFVFVGQNTKAITTVAFTNTHTNSVTWWHMDGIRQSVKWWLGLVDRWMDGWIDAMTIAMCIGACVCVCAWWVYNIFTVMNVHMHAVHMIYQKGWQISVFCCYCHLFGSHSIICHISSHRALGVGGGRQVIAHSLRCDMHRATNTQPTHTCRCELCLRLMK